MQIMLDLWKQLKHSLFPLGMPAGEEQFTVEITREILARSQAASKPPPAPTRLLAAYSQFTGALQVRL